MVNKYILLLTLITVTFCINTACSTKSKQLAPNWTSSTKQGDIPDKTISGIINGSNIKINYVRVKKWPNEYDITFSTKKPDTPCGIIVENDAVNFSTKEIFKGTFSKKMGEQVKFDDYHAYYHYEQDNGIPMSVNTDWAGTLVVKKLDKKEKNIKGFADFKFKDNLTGIGGEFTAEYCE